jgi:phage gp29-like protein
LRPHNWFALDQYDQNKIVIKGLQDDEAQLWSLGWVSHRHRAKPGYVARTGLHRMLAWPYLFQNYALGDLAQLLEIYGLPARIGQYPRGATNAEKAALLRAVTSLGRSAAGIIPEGMKIDFLNAAEGRADVYQAMLDWCERAKAKVILGGTLTSGTGEGTNTNALGNVHERGLNSLIRSDVRQYAGTIRRDILWPMAALNFGIEDLRRAPKFWLDTDETEDYKALSDTLPTFVDMGMKIPIWWVHEKTGIPTATDEDEVLQAKAKPAPFAPGETTPADKTDVAATRIAALRSGTALASDALPAQIEAALKSDPTAGWIEQIRKVVDEADSLEALRDRLVEMTAELDTGSLADALAEAMAAAHLAGRFDLMEGL